MIKTTTLSDLFSYAYNEADLIDSDRIQRSLDGDPLLRDEYEGILRMQSVLDSAMPEVKSETIEKILQFC